MDLNIERYFGFAEEKSKNIFGFDKKRIRNMAESEAEMHLDPKFESRNTQ